MVPTVRHKSDLQLSSRVDPRCFPTTFLFSSRSLLNAHLVRFFVFSASDSLAYPYVLFIVRFRCKDTAIDSKVLSGRDEKLLIEATRQRLVDHFTFYNNESSPVMQFASHEQTMQYHIYTIICLSFSYALRDIPSPRSIHLRRFINRIL